MKRFATLTLMFILSTVCLLDDSAASVYLEGAHDHSTMATKMTLEATDIVVGEITDVSLVFEQDTSGLLSIVTVRVDKDIKAEIERVARQATNPVGQVSEEKGITPPGDLTQEEGDTPPETVSFVQVGGPWGDGTWVKAAGVDLLKNGDYVFLRLKPTIYTVFHEGQEYNSCIDEYGTTFFVQEQGDDIDHYIINEGWQRTDVNVLDMTRIVRTTLEQPETMRTLEREVHERGRIVPNQTRLQTIMNKVAEIEETLNLPPFDPDDQ